MEAYNHTVTSRGLNWSGEDVKDYLRRLSQDKVQDMTPTIAFFVLLIIVGIPGNTFVILVYWKCFKASSTRVFALAMAVFDLLSSALSFPLIIFEFHFLYDFPDFHFCKVMQALQMLPFAASSWVLVVVALDRRHRICQPFKRQLKPRHAFYAVILSLILASLLTFPFLPLKGESHVKTEFDGVFGRRCGYQDTYKNSTYTKIETSLLTVNILVGLFVFLFCYSHLGYRLYKQKKKRTLPSPGVNVKRREETRIETSATKGTEDLYDVDKYIQKVHTGHHKINTLPACAVRDMETDILCEKPTQSVSDSARKKHSVSLLSVADRECQNPDCHNLTELSESSGLEDIVVHSKLGSNASTLFSKEVSRQTEDTTQTTTIVNADSSGSPAGEVTAGQRRKPKPDQRLESSSDQRHREIKKRSRTTLMMFVLNLTAIVTFLPYIIVTVIHNGAFESCPLTNGWAMNLCLIVATFPYLNCAVNPFIYSLCNPDFRLKSLQFLGMARNMFPAFDVHLRT